MFPIPCLVKYPAMPWLSVWIIQVCIFLSVHVNSTIDNMPYDNTHTFNAPINVMPHYIATSHPGNVIGGDLKFAKFKCTTKVQMHQHTSRSNPLGNLCPTQKSRNLTISAFHMQVQSDSHVWGKF